VLRTNPAHYLLIDNTERKVCEKENNELHQGKTSPLKHNTGIWKYRAFVFIHKVIYRFEMFLPWTGTFPSYPSLSVSPTFFKIVGFIAFT
jgi:hypothetical protein